MPGAVPYPALPPEARATAEPNLWRVVDRVCAALGAEARVDCRRDYPTSVNHEDACRHAAAVAAEVFGKEGVDLDPPQTMIVEDFAFMPEGRPGCYGWIGNGPDTEGRILHSARFDFNDEALPYGASYLARLVEAALPTTG